MCNLYELNLQIFPRFLQDTGLFKVGLKQVSLQLYFINIFIKANHLQIESCYQGNQIFLASPIKKKLTQKSYFVLVDCKLYQ